VGASSNGTGHYVACHFPLAPGETLDFSTTSLA
jgi:hypothetical protein